MKKTIQWGILGCGRIARAFARGLQALPDARLEAVASTSLDRAKQMASEFGGPTAYGDYTSFLEKANVDVVYISTTHNFHYENAKLCLEHGKAVLCEKAFTVNARQAAEVIDLARKKNLFLMEAMWTRFLPATVRLRGALASGVIGDVLTLKADFHFRSRADASDRWLNPALAGGALLDLGIYPIAYAHMIFGRPPESIEGSAVMSSTGVDEESHYHFHYEGGKSAHLSSSLRSFSPHEALLCGSEGFIRVPEFFHANGFEIHREGKDPERVNLPHDAPGYQYEAAEVHACLRSGRTESDLMPLSETLDTMRTMDALRAMWGLVYPGE